MKLGRRLGDSAEMAILELVDWNESGAPKQKVSKPRPTRRKAPVTKPAEIPGIMPEPTPTIIEEVTELPPQD